MMKDKAAAPGFAIVAEPEVTEILVQQQRENWGLSYKRFADVTTVLDPDGLPLWVINQPTHASEFLKAFERAVSYVNDPQNAPSVSVMITEGFKRYFNAFPELGTPQVNDMLRRGNLIFRYKEASAIKTDLIRLWQEFEIAPDEDIFYVGGD